MIGVMIVVTGASGRVGGAVVNALADLGLPVRAVSRSGHHETTHRPLVEHVEGNLDVPRSMSGPLAGSEALFLLSGFAGTAAVLDRARDAGTKRVVLLSSGCVAGGDRANAVVRYNAESEDAVRESELQWTVLRPSGFMSNALRWQPELAHGNTVRVPFADIPVAVIDPADIASAAVPALTSDRLGGEILRLTGPEALTPVEQLTILGQVLDRDLRARELSVDEARDFYRETLPEPYVDAFMSFSADRTYDDSIVDPTLPRVTGRPANTFTHWAEANGAEFTK